MGAVPDEIVLHIVMKIPLDCRDVGEVKNKNRDEEVGDAR